MAILLLPPFVDADGWPPAGVPCCDPARCAFYRLAALWEDGSVAARI
ncbi:MAG TPA: hypothetical protein PLH19_15985 [Anaerolineae bacterium]|nr:hypothetical protein [Anaerolineae bacterium]